MSEFLSHDLNMSSLPFLTILATTDIPGWPSAEFEFGRRLGDSGSVDLNNSPSALGRPNLRYHQATYRGRFRKIQGFYTRSAYLLVSSDLQLTAHSKQGKQEGSILFLQKAFHRFATRCRRMPGLKGDLHITFTFVVRSLSQGHRRNPRQLRLLKIGPDQCVVEEVPEPAPPRPPPGYPSRCRSTQIRGCPRNAGKSPGDYCTPLSPCTSS